MKTVVEDSKRCNTAAMRKRLKIVRGKELLRRKAFNIALYLIKLFELKLPPYMRRMLHTWLDKAFVQNCSYGS